MPAPRGVHLAVRPKCRSEHVGRGGRGVCDRQLKLGQQHAAVAQVREQLPEGEKLSGGPLARLTQYCQKR